MTAQQKIDFREIYTQLKLQLVDPGDSFAGVRKTYAPVDRYALSWDALMLTPDTPAVARERRYEKTMWFSVGARLAS